LLKQRIDTLLVDRELVESRAKAQALIMAGDVTVDGKVIIKPGTMVPDSAAVTVNEPSPFVSRGGIKLNGALERLAIDVTDSVVVDIGASTGGFTDCLLQRGANRVYAIDVGYGLIDYRLRKDSRVVVIERTNARYPINLPEKVDLITIDVAFISVEKIIPSAVQLLKDNGCILVLLKPQFEAKKGEVGRGGVIKKPVLQATILGRFIVWLTGHGFRLGGLVASPILGAAGNQEFFIVVKLT
jgi:23S rRNA (cytidine1920-2'-O)/16S rRNA (cytidine1409-2'-O)-methyltransferase